MQTLNTLNRDTHRRPKRSGHELNVFRFWDLGNPVPITASHHEKFRADPFAAVPDRSVTGRHVVLVPSLCSTAAVGDGVVAPEDGYGVKIWKARDEGGFVCGEANGIGDAGDNMHDKRRETDGEHL